MAEAHSFQSATLCGFCENPAQYQCQNCDDPLCTSCKKKHEKKKPHHKYVPYSQKARTVCRKHTDHKYMYWCESCRETCCTKCVVKWHTGHFLIEIEDAIRAKKAAARKALNGSLQTCLKKWESLSQLAGQMRSQYATQVQKMDDDIISHTANITTSVEKNLAKVCNELQVISKSDKTALERQEQEINTKYEEFQARIRKIEDLQETCYIELLECNLEVTDVTEYPTLTHHVPPRYSPGQINDESILTMIGNLKVTMQGLKTGTVKTPPKPPSDLHTLVPLPSVQRHPSKPTGLLSSPAVISSINTAYSHPYIACTTSSGLAWVRTGDRQVKLVDLHGAVRDTINANFAFHSLTTTPKGDVWFTNYGNCCIKSASKVSGSWIFKTIFTTQYQPAGLCLLCNGEVVVTYPSVPQVIQYNRKWQIVHAFDPSLFLCPVAVAVNHANGDLYVSDPTKHTLLAFKKTHGLRYEYIKSSTSSFDPQHASTDASGRIFVVDVENKRIHILNQDGNFLQYLQYLGLNKPRYIDVDNDGNAWIGEFRGQVKIVDYQYL